MSPLIIVTDCCVQVDDQWQRDLVYLCAVAKYKLRHYLAAREQLAELLRVRTHIMVYLKGLHDCTSVDFLDDVYCARYDNVCSVSCARGMHQIVKNECVASAYVNTLAQ